MFLNIIIIFFTLVSLAALHEFGHFILAKKVGVRVEEFGIGYPPRILGKKFGETIYSLNALPFGAFVKIYGEESEIKDPESFREKPIGQRAIIALGGVLSFWIIAVILLTFIFGIGAPVGISDAEIVPDSKVQIVAIATGSPAQTKDLKAGDIIRELKSSSQSQVEGDEKLKITKVKEVQDFVDAYLGEEITLTIERGNEIFDVSLIPRVDPPAGEGAIGVNLARITIKSYPFYLAPFKAIETCWQLSLDILSAFGRIVRNLFQEKELPEGVGLMGPIGIASLMNQFYQTGFIYYLQFVALLSLHLAIINLLPIPAVDGGRLLFLGIEKIKGSPIQPRIEQKINSFFFALLIIMMIFITIRDIRMLF